MLQGVVGSCAMEAWPRRDAAPAILVVEDEPLLLDMIAETLEVEGFCVSVAASAAEALDILRRWDSIRLLFTDIDMPGGMDGYALAREARGLRPELKVVYTSGARRSLTGEGAVPDSLFVPKPYRPLQVSRLLAPLVAA